MEKTLVYDMRAPAFGAKATDLYEAALDQVAWADEMGFDFVGLGEHHAAEDGYDPSPLLLVSAMAARSKRIRLRTSVLLAPFYDPIKLAEDAAVAQIISAGRLVLGIGAGYRPAEFAMFGRDLANRWQTLGDVCKLLRLAWKGEPFEWQGRPCHVTPAPDPPPPILLGGSSAAAARRAAHIADGWFPPLDPRLWKPYREECLKLGKCDPGPCKVLGPIFTHVSKTPEADWESIAPHAAHCARSYAEWTVEAYGRAAGPFSAGVDMEDLRRSGAYQVLGPEEAIRMIRGLGPDRTFILTPLLGGLDPGLSWRGLRLFEDEVWPYVRDLQG